MTYGAALFLIAAGAILRYAVHENTDVVSLPTVGLILMIVGGIGLIMSIALLVLGPSSRRDAPPPPPQRDRDTY